MQSMHSEFSVENHGDKLCVCGMKVGGGGPKHKCHHCHIVTPRRIVRLNVYFSSHPFNLYCDKSTQHVTKCKCLTEKIHKFDYFCTAVSL